MQIPFTSTYQQAKVDSLESVDLSVPFCGPLSALAYRDHSIKYFQWVFKEFLIDVERNKILQKNEAAPFINIEPLYRRIKTYIKRSNFDKSWISFMLRFGADDFLQTVRAITASNVFGGRPYVNVYLEHVSLDAERIIDLRKSYVIPPVPREALSFLAVRTNSLNA
ncbi:hypothetical protein FV219_00755 [Methylobacterium sp. WL122]|nr:hypothetical protein FV219_00755 [Methylobacterium sp. WL122]